MARAANHRVPVQAAPGTSRADLSRHALASVTHRRGRLGLGLAALALLLVAVLATTAQAATVGLGTAGSFSILGGSTVSNTGPSVLSADLGVSPGAAITGFPPGTVLGATHANDAVAHQAQLDLVTAYDDAAGRSSTATVSGDLAGRTLNPGVYTSASSLGLTGDLTLNAGGDPNAVFVFQAGSTLTTGSGSHVLLSGGAQACNVFWKVGSSATIGTATAFTGNILALTSISMTTGATLDGRALARNGAVTLDTNSVTRSPCTTGGSATGTGSGTTGTGTGAGTSTARVSPAVITEPASHMCFAGARLARERARLRGTVRPGAGAGRYYFQFGTTKRYVRTTQSLYVAPGTTAFKVHADVGHLLPNRLYHYRIVGVGADGKKTYGADGMLRTRNRDVCTPHIARPPRTPQGYTG